MLNKVFLSILLILAVAGSATAQTVNVTKLTPDRAGKISVYDENGTLKGSLDIADFPPVPFPALKYDADNDIVKVSTSKGDYWLVPANFRIDQEATIATECEVALRVRTARGPAQEGLSRGFGDCK